MKRGAPLKRSELRRTSWLPRGVGIRQTAMRATRSKGAKRQDVLRRSAYSVVDERSRGWCEARMPPHGVKGWPSISPWGCPNRAVQHHHRRPRRAGGSTDPTTETAANIVHLCAIHHESAERNRELAYEMGLLVRAGHDPATTPVLLHAGWVTLNDEGTYTPTKETL